MDTYIYIHLSIYINIFLQRVLKHSLNILLTASAKALAKYIFESASANSICFWQQVLKRSLYIIINTIFWQRALKRSLSLFLFYSDFQIAQIAYSFLTASAKALANNISLWQQPLNHSLSIYVYDCERYALDTYIFIKASAEALAKSIIYLMSVRKCLLSIFIFCIKC